MSDLLNKSFTSEELNGSKNAINRTFSSDSSGMNDSLLDEQKSRLEAEMLDKSLDFDKKENPDNAENDPKAIKKDELEKVIKKVKENMPEPLAKKEYSVIELRDELDKARYDAVDMGDVKGKRIRDKEKNIDKHSEGYMTPLIDAIDTLESQLGKKVSKQTIDADIAAIGYQYDEIRKYAETYLAKRKNPHSDEGKARKRMVQLILNSLEGEKKALSAHRDDLLLMLDEGFAVAYSEALIGANAKQLDEVKIAETKNIEGVGILAGDDVIINDDDVIIDNNTKVSDIIKMTMKETDDELERLKPQIETIRKEHTRHDLRVEYRLNPQSKEAALYKIILRYDHLDAVHKMKEKLFAAVKEIEDKGEGNEVQRIFASGDMTQLNDVVKRMTKPGSFLNFDDSLKPAFKESKLYYIFSKANEASASRTKVYEEYRQSGEHYNAVRRAESAMNSRLYNSNIVHDGAKMTDNESIYDKKLYQEELDDLKKAEEAEAKYFDQSDDDYFALYRATMDIQKFYKRQKTAEKAKIMGAKKLPQRKVAVSIMAEALDMKELVEEAKFAETKIDGKKKVSVITGQSDGKTIDAVLTEVDSLGMKFRYSTNSLKDVMSIKALDFICGISRNKDEIKGSFTMKDDGTVEMSGIKAVSNELSFGTRSLNADYNVAMELPALDIKTANQILWLKTGFLDFYLKGLVSKEEIEAAKGRLRALKSVIRKQMSEGAAGAPRILHTDEDWEEFRKEFESNGMQGSALDERLRGNKRCIGHGKVHD